MDHSRTNPLDTVPINDSQERKAQMRRSLYCLLYTSSIISVALGKHQQLLSCCLCDVASGLNDRDRPVSYTHLDVYKRQVQARNNGFKLMQFNAVVENNTHARHLYERLGFVQVGMIPNGFLMKDGSYQNIFLYYHVL